MTRLEWLLGGVLSLLLIAGLILAAFIFWPEPELPDPISLVTASGTRPELLMQATSVYSGQTALTAYRKAEASARQWAADAQMMRGAASWPEGSRFETGEESWDFTFYSAAKASVALIAVVEDRVTLVSEQRTFETPQLPEAAAWQVDSPAAVQRLLTDGGQAFIEEQGPATLLLTLAAEADDFYWEMVLFKAESGQTLAVRLNAATGLVSP